MSKLSEFMEHGKSMKFFKWGTSKTDSILLTAEISPDGHLHIHLPKDGVTKSQIQLVPELLISLAAWITSKIDS